MELERARTEFADRNETVLRLEQLLCAERRAELMGGGRGKSVELREVLFARKHQFGCRQRIRELARFLGDLPGMQADEGDRGGEHGPRRPDIAKYAYPQRLRQGPATMYRTPNRPDTCIEVADALRGTAPGGQMLALGDNLNSLPGPVG